MGSLPACSGIVRILLFLLLIIAQNAARFFFWSFRVFACLFFSVRAGFGIL